MTPAPSEPLAGSAAAKPGTPVAGAETTSSAIGDLPFGESPRSLKLSVSRVELRMYSRTRTSASIIKRPQHFEYVVRCDWSGPTSPEAAKGDESGDTPGAGGCWWDALPATYEVRRRWLDIARFHELLCTELTHDTKVGFTRVKGKVPELPQKGDIDTFEKTVAATGDTLALSRAKKNVPLKEGDPWDDLDLLHTIYVDHRLNPYFAEVNKVLAEVPAKVIEESLAFRKFVTSGVSCKIRDRTPLGMVQEKFAGPAPHRFDPDLLAEAAAELRKSCGGSVLAKFRPRSSRRERASTLETSLSSSSKPPSPPSPPRGHLPPTPSSPRFDKTLSLATSAPTLGATLSDGDLLSPTGSFSFGGGTTRFGRAATCWSSLPEEDREERRKQRLASSHYGFFAESLKHNQDHGWPSQRDYWRRMHIKERAEIGRRTLLSPGKLVDGDSARAWRDTPVRRLPALPPSADGGGPGHLPGSPGRLGGLGRASSTPSLGAAGGGTEKAPMPLKYLQADAILRDITEGLRATFLGMRPASSLKHSRRQDLEARGEATKEETLKVYKVYRTIRRGMVREDGEVVDSEEEDKDEGGMAFKDLGPVSWHAFLAWAGSKEDFAEDFRFKSTCGALNRALKLWHQRHATAESRQQGIHFCQFVKWIWPDVTSEHMAAMLTWVWFHEIEKIRQPTPRLIDQDQRRRLEGMFRSMDHGEKGHCTAEDIAGGRNQGIEGKLRNIVDVDTVRAVCGDRPLGPTEFLELMCEDDYRAHSGAQQVVLKDGRKLKQQVRDVAGITIWVLDEPPPREVIQRQLVDAIEAEIKRWRRMAVVEATGLQPLLSFGDEARS